MKTNKKSSSGSIPLILMSLCFCIVIIWQLLHKPNTMERELPGSEISMRGNIIVVVRFNTRAVPQQLLISPDGLVSRTTNPPDQTREIAYRLSPDMNDELLHFRQDMCVQQTYRRSVMPNASVYDIGIRCDDNSHDVQQWSISEGSLPSVLRKIDQLVPELTSQ